MQITKRFKPKNKFRLFMRSVWNMLRHKHFIVYAFQELPQAKGDVFKSEYTGTDFFTDEGHIVISQTMCSFVNMRSQMIKYQCAEAGKMDKLAAKASAILSACLPKPRRRQGAEGNKERGLS